MSQQRQLSVSAELSVSKWSSRCRTGEIEWRVCDNIQPISANDCSAKTGPRERPHSSTGYVANLFQFQHRRLRWERLEPLLNLCWEPREIRHVKVHRPAFPDTPKYTGLLLSRPVASTPRSSTLVLLHNITGIDDWTLSMKWLIPKGEVYARPKVL